MGQECCILTSEATSPIAAKSALRRGLGRMAENVLGAYISFEILLNRQEGRIPWQVALAVGSVLCVGLCCATEGYEIIKQLVPPDPGMNPIPTLTPTLTPMF